jgi:hypothetical protein
VAGLNQQMAMMNFAPRAVPGTSSCFRLVVGCSFCALINASHYTVIHELYRCGMAGHLARACPRGPTAPGVQGARVCFKCGQEGHLAKMCPAQGVDAVAAPETSKKCYVCGMHGHLARDCAQGNSGSGKQADRPCFNCGMNGHVARDCTQPRSERTCYKCNLQVPLVLCRHMLVLFWHYFSGSHCEGLHANRRELNSD